MKDLETLRAEIAGIDREIVRLVSERMAAVEQVAEYKKAEGLPVVNPDVEKRVVMRYRAAAEAAGCDPDMMERIARTLISEAVARENELIR